MGAIIINKTTGVVRYKELRTVIVSNVQVKSKFITFELPRYLTECYWKF